MRGYDILEPSRLIQKNMCLGLMGFWNGGGRGNNDLRVISLAAETQLRERAYPGSVEAKHRRAPKLPDICVSPSHGQRLTNNAARLTGVPDGKARPIATFIVRLSSRLS